MSLRLKIFVSCLCLLFLGASVESFAQDDLFKKAEKAYRKQQVKSFKDGSRHFLGEGGGEVTHNPFKDPNMFCEDGDEKCIESDFPEFKNQPRMDTFGTYAPVSDFQTGMGAGVLMDSLKDGIKGPLALYFITLFLTEPAVGGGLGQAVQRVGFDQLGRYQAEQNFLKQFEYYENLNPQIPRAYLTCINAKMAGKDGEPKGRPQAMTECLGDNFENLKESQKKFDTKKVDKNAAFTFEFDNDHNPDNDKKEIKLSEYLFQADSQDDGYKRLRDDFVKNFGDIIFTLDANESASGPDVVGSRGVTTKKIAAENDFKDVYEETVEEVYDNLTEAMYLRCKHGNEDGGGRVCTGRKGEGEDNCGDIWYDILTVDDNAGGGKISQVDLSMKGYTFKPVLAEAMFGLFLDVSRAGKLDEGFCREQLSKNGEYKFDNLKQSTDKIDRRVKAYLFYAERIALAQLLGKFMAAEKFIQSVTIGPFDSFAKGQAYNLLYEAAGTRELQVAYNLNMEKLAKFIEVINEFRQSVIGRDVGGYKNTKGDGTSNAGADPMRGG